MLRVGPQFDRRSDERRRVEVAVRSRDAEALPANHKSDVLCTPFDRSSYGVRSVFTRPNVSLLGKELFRDFQPPRSGGASQHLAREATV